MALTPMMQQYFSIKENYPDVILFYRLGDFYEMFFEDAIVASKVLNLVLTSREAGLPEKAPMCGIPHHSAEGYIVKLIEAGYKVGICEQLTAPQKGVKIVERDVVRVITPGTLIDSSLLDDKTNNFIASCYKNGNSYGVSYVDISAGTVYLSELTGKNALSELNDLLVRVKPREILSNRDMFLESADLLAYKLGVIPKFSSYEDRFFNNKNSEKAIKEQVENDEYFKTLWSGLSNKKFALASVSALLNYLSETQKRSMSHINKFEYLQNETYMTLDANTRRNLELSESLRDRKKTGSLLWLLDKTETSMGARMIRSFVEQPLYNEKEINNRLNSVEELVRNAISRDSLQETLKKVSDIERLCGRISYGNLTPKDAIALLNSLIVLPQISKTLNNYKTPMLKDINSKIYDYTDVVNMLHSGIVDNPPTTFKDGGVIKKGFNKELDELLDISANGKQWLAQLEATERERTGIKNLKIGYNSVFGYFIEVLKSQLDLVPYNYVRKQTISAAERFITDELKVMEEKILTANEKSQVLEVELFSQIREFLLDNVSAMQETARAVAKLDALLSLAKVAIENNYVKPSVRKNIKEIKITDGRHPVVEKLLKDEEFVPNDTLLDEDENRTMIITGPNMAGKSTYMRQVALITVMAHIGSFVPATSAEISLTDKVFTRVGASDDLAFGQSTFMVEMVEVSNILHQATENSLIILDEVGRGTSTFDGLSIAWSVMEYLAKHHKAKTLFATHYHELTELEGVLHGVKNYRVNVKEFNNTIIFLRKIVRGGANKSFGIEVAKLAGLPEIVLDRARDILHNLELNDSKKSETLQSVNTDIENHKRIKTNQEIVNILSDVSIDNLTPLNAFEILVDLVEKTKNKI